ncbi:hypothetical protein [Lutimonas sp.]|uniref:hypothetical protein n=1 Tax=Lutimonas sp. TaxID=1872403 RepID=UPI003D9B0FB3
MKTEKLLFLIKERIITGIVVIVPIAVVVIILKDTVQKLIDLTLPFTSNMLIGGPVFRTIIASLILLTLAALIFFVCGFILKTYFGSIFRNWLERKVLEHIPFFKTMKNVIHQVSGIEHGDYTAVEVDLNGNNNIQIGIHTDTLPDGRYAVYIPFAPIVNIGQVFIVAKENVKVLDIKLKDFMDINSKLGFEAKKTYSKTN